MDEGSSSNVLNKFRKMLGGVPVSFQSTASEPTSQTSSNVFWYYTRKRSYGTFNPFALLLGFDKEIRQLIVDVIQLKQFAKLNPTEPLNFQKAFKTLDSIYLKFIANGALHIFCLVNVVNASCKMDANVSFMKDFFNQYASRFHELNSKHSNLKAYLTDENFLAAEKCSELSCEKIQLVKALRITKKPDQRIIEKIKSIDLAVSGARVFSLFHKMLSIAHLVDDLKKGGQALLCKNKFQQTL